MTVSGGQVTAKIDSGQTSRRGLALIAVGRVPPN